MGEGELSVTFGVSGADTALVVGQRVDAPELAKRGVFLHHLADGGEAAHVAAVVDMVVIEPIRVRA